ncbi:MAG TPA: glycosyltransferase family 2 protein [Rhodothermales bacterium]|nr:glycosyltransferase family 2 protein [Rhodothermales bacterium]
MEKGPDISVLVPVFNERESLAELAGEIEAACDLGRYSFEVLFVDDGSNDGSWDEIERLHREDPRFRGIRFQKNYGKSAAIAVGFQEVRGAYVVTIDADLQDDPAEIPGLVALLEDGYDLASGWKKSRNDPFMKTITSRFFNFTTRVVSGIKLHDFNCGLKAYHVNVVRQLKVYGEMHRYLPVLAKWEGFTRIAERPVNHRARKFGDTKFGLERFIRGFLDLISVFFLTRFAVRPMHFFGTLGTLSFLGGLGINLYLTFEWLSGEPIGRRPLLFLGMLLIILGVQLFSTGLLAEMIIRPRMENPGTYQIRDRLDPVRLKESPSQISTSV